jgi:hypothetical protein
MGENMITESIPARPRDEIAHHRIRDVIAAMAGSGVQLRIKPMQRRTGATYFECQTVLHEMQASGEIGELQAEYSAKRAARRAAKAEPAPTDEVRRASGKPVLSDDEVQAKALAACQAAIAAGRGLGHETLREYGALGSASRITQIRDYFLETGQIVARTIVRADPPAPTKAPTKCNGGPVLDRKPVAYTGSTSPVADDIRGAISREKTSRLWGLWRRDGALQ